ncbi:MAG TPA: phosphoribosylamine--glycine ligase [Candidatus Limnocylindrales bacterium]|nr:phosphoribosylamine--glycine ligase [Candidatus Limnocylindrales bacterium]
MRVLLIGGGGREHALAWAISQSPRLTELIAAPGNPGIARHARPVPVRDPEVDDLTALALRERVNLAVVGPELPLSLGIVDRLRAAGVAAFGPTAAAARIESSKGFAKELMARHDIPTARFGVFTSAVAARAFARTLGAPVVVKADGLAAGKGAVVCRALDEADRAIAQCMEERAFGAAGLTVVVEEFMVGEEGSFFVLSDGASVLPFGTAQDHKTVFDDDQGPNTGGMGAYSPAPVVDGAMADRVMVEIVRPAVAAMAKAGAPYAGFLFVGVMITRDGPRVVEFNCRFGDPECQVVMPRLDEDLLPLLDVVARGGAVPSRLRWRPDASACVVLASGGYPGPYETGLPIAGLDDEGGLEGVNVFHAATAVRGRALVTAGGRVLGVQALGPDLPAAVARAYAAAARVRFDGVHFRRDIGRRALSRSAG